MKKGISLVYLVITIVVITILTAMIVLNIQNSIDNTRTITFAEELYNILNGVKEYYLVHGEYPVDTEMVYTKNALLTIPVNSIERELLDEDINLNQDNDSIFYKIDRSLLEVSGGLYGKEDSEMDFYVINSDATKIYYPLGIKIGDNYYFSLNEEMLDIININASDIYSERVQVISSINAINVQKNTEEYTSNLVLTYYTNLNAGETLKYTLGEVTYNLETSSGIVQINSQDLTTSQKSNLNTNNYVIFQKYNSNNEIISISKIDIENLDYIAPTVGNVIIESAHEYNIVKFPFATDDKNKIYSYYTTDPSLNESEILSNGIKVLGNKIKLTKDISYIKLVLVDEVGNISDAVEVNI